MSENAVMAEPATVKGWCPGALRPMQTGDGLLVRRVAKREQKTDGDGVRIELGQRRQVELLEHAVGPHPLAYAGAPLERDERLGMLVAQPVEVGAVLTAQVEELLEALRRDERRPRSLPGHAPRGAARRPHSLVGHAASFGPGARGGGSRCRQAAPPGCAAGQAGAYVRHRFRSGNVKLPRILVLKTGSTAPDLVRTDGDYEDWFIAALERGPERTDVLPAEGKLPDPRRWGGVILTGSPASGGDWLVGGNLNDDRFIDILDFGIFIGDYGQAPGSDTPCDLTGSHSDIGGDGMVDASDFNFISINFLNGSEPNCCGLPGAMTPVERISVAELIATGRGVRRPVSARRRVHEQSVPDLHVQQAPDERPVVGEAGLVLAQEPLDEGGIEDASSADRRRREHIAHERAGLAAEPDRNWHREALLLPVDDRVW